MIFEQQRLASFKVWWLNIVFVIMMLLVCATCFVVLDLSFCMRLVIGAKTKPACRFLYLFVAGIIIVGFFIKHYKISRGNIAYLSLNATEISIQKPLKYETLAHIIEEMAIASNMPMARAFVLEKWA